MDNFGLLTEILGPDIGGPYGPYKQVLREQATTPGHTDSFSVRKNVFVSESCRKATATGACVSMFLFARAFGRLCKGEETPWSTQRLRSKL